MKKKVFQFIPWILVGIMVLFIFGNSLIPAVGSKQISFAFTTAIHNLLLSININLDYEFLHHLIRKFAHFLEYAILGGLIYLAIQTKPLTKSTTTNFVCFLVVPIIDESLQLITPGRSCELGDMMIDGSGMIVGFLLIWLIVKCLVKQKATH